MRFPAKIAITLLLLFTVCCCYLSCKKEDAQTPAIQYNYYPLQSGKYIIYQADSILYNDFTGKIDTVHHQFKDIIGSTVSDSFGDSSYIISRYIRDNASAEWQPDENYTVTKTKTNILLQENNLKFIKLIFPVNEGRSWNGNSYIDPSYEDNLQYLSNWTYAYQEINQPLTINQQSFDSTLTVVQDDESIETPEYAMKTYSVEKYALKVGMVYKEIIHWEQQCGQRDGNGNCTQLGAKKGFGLILTIIDHD